MYKSFELFYTSIWKLAKDQLKSKDEFLKSQSLLNQVGYVWTLCLETRSMCVWALVKGEGLVQEMTGIASFNELSRAGWLARSHSLWGWERGKDKERLESNDPQEAFLPLSSLSLKPLVTPRTCFRKWATPAAGRKSAHSPLPTVRRSFLLKWKPSESKPGWSTGPTGNRDSKWQSGTNSPPS